MSTRESVLRWCVRARAVWSECVPCSCLPPTQPTRVRTARTASKATCSASRSAWAAASGATSSRTARRSSPTWLPMRPRAPARRRARSASTAGTQATPAATALSPSLAVRVRVCVSVALWALIHTLECCVHRRRVVCALLRVRHGGPLEWQVPQERSGRLPQCKRAWPSPSYSSCSVITLCVCVCVHCRAAPVRCVAPSPTTRLTARRTSGAPSPRRQRWRRMPR